MGTARYVCAFCSQYLKLFRAHLDADPRAPRSSGWGHANWGQAWKPPAHAGQQPLQDPGSCSRYFGLISIAGCASPIPRESSCAHALSAYNLQETDPPWDSARTCPVPHRCVCILVSNDSCECGPRRCRRETSCSRRCKGRR